MAKLSRAGWNNVIIFAVMGFILIINATNKNVFDRDSDNGLSKNSSWVIMPSS